MAVVVETTIGDFTIDLFVDARPQACKNFLKLCKMKYYNFCLFHSVQPNFLAQTGDPTGSGNGGESIYGLLYGENARYFEAEMMPKLRHHKPGLVSMVNCGNSMLGSQFFITLGEELVSLDQEHCVFGEITEGIEIVLRLNEAICDSLHRPYKDIRITHTVILDDPFEDPSGLIAPDMSPEPSQEKLANGRIGADEAVDETAGLSAGQVEELKQEREARARATILEIVGDLPDAEMAPPENVLFVCKLNPVTTDDDLEIIFSRFGKVKSCEVIRDKNTGDSLQYAFVEFEDQKACEEAYFKMDNVLIDDRRIHVDFSQSVAKMRWKGKGRGVDYFDNKEQPRDSKSTTHRDRDESKSRSSTRRDRDYEERERRRDRGRDREDDRQGRDKGREEERPGREREEERGRERVKEKEGDERHRRRDDRDRSRSDWRKRDTKRDRKDDYRDDDRRYDSKRRDVEGSRKKEDDLKRVSSISSSRKVDEKKYDEKRLDERKREKESKDVNGRSSSQQSFVKSESVEKPGFKGSTERLEVKKDNDRGSKYSSPFLSVTKEDTLSDSFLPNVEEDVAKSPHAIASQLISGLTTEVKTSHVSRRSSKDDRKHEEETNKGDDENGDGTEVKISQKDDKRTEGIKALDDKKKTKRKQKVSESRKRKKRRHSSSSESSSESSDSSDSSSSSDSSDYRHSKKKKLIVAKRYYRGGKLVKEVKKKRRTKDTSESESGSEESSDSDSKRKRKLKKHKKVINIFQHPRKKPVGSSEESKSGSSSSEDSDAKSKKKKRKVVEKQPKKKTKNVSSKKKKKRKDSSSSSDSEDSDQNKSISKKIKKSAKSSKCNTGIVSTTSE